MSDFDDRVRNSLDRQVRGIDEPPDWDDLSDRLVRRDQRRNRVLVAALVVSLLAGPALGFVAGRGGNDDGDDVRAVATDGDEVEVGDTGAPPVIERDTDAGGAVDGSVAPLANTFMAPRAATEGASWSDLSIGYGSSEPMARLFVRDAGATRVRVYRAANEAYDDGIPWWDPPAYCYPSGWVQADISTEFAVGIAGGSTYAALRDGAVSAQLTLLGIGEDEPTWAVVAQVPPEAAIVRTTFPGGGSDEMAPVDGIAVLVARAADGTTYEDQWETTAMVDALDASGRVIATGDTSAMYVEQAATDECNPPPEPMPEPGAEQPADPAAARAEIEALYGKRWDEVTDEERLATLDDPRGIQQVYDELMAGPYADAVRSARSTLDEVVFLSATRAAIRYDTDLEGYPPDAYDNMLTEAVLVDGHWKLTREGFCSQIRAAGVACPDV